MEGEGGKGAGRGYYCFGGGGEMAGGDEGGEDTMERKGERQAEHHR